MSTAMVCRMTKAADKIRRWCDRNDYTQRRLAERADMHPSRFSEILQDKRVPTLREAVELERITGVPCKLWLR